MKIIRTAAALTIVAAGVTAAPTLAGAWCSPSDADWNPNQPLPAECTTTTEVPRTTTSVAPSTTSTTIVAPTTTTEAVLGDVVVNIGEAISITRSTGAGAVPVDDVELAG